MKRAVISDIHANLEALQAVLADIEREQVDEIVCLGDVVGYGPDPNECAQLIQQRCTFSILGNHDAAAIGTLSTANFNVHARRAIEWTTKEMNRHTQSFLKTNPLKKILGDCLCVHATPYEPNMWHYITTYQDAQVNFEYFEQRICLVGHTHIPVMIGWEHPSVYLHQKSSLSLAHFPHNRFIINVGSVGQPRDNDNRSCYVIMDTGRESFYYRRVEYDIERYQEKMERIAMPSFLITRVAEGI